MDMLVGETDWESVQEWDEYWGKWSQSRSEAFNKRMDPLVVSVSRELFLLRE
jgi:hypothetical protein